MKKITRLFVFAFALLLVILSLSSCNSSTTKGSLSDLPENEMADKIREISEENMQGLSSATEEVFMEMYFESSGIEFHATSNLTSYVKTDVNDSLTEIVSKSVVKVESDGEAISTLKIKDGYVDGHSFYHIINSLDNTTLALKSEEDLKTYNDYVDYKNKSSGNFITLIDSCEKKSGKILEDGYELTYSLPSEEGVKQIIYLLAGLENYIEEKWTISDVITKIKLDSDFYITSYDLEVIYTASRKTAYEIAPLLTISSKYYDYNKTQMPQIDLENYDEIDGLTELLKVPDYIEEIFKSDSANVTLNIKQTQSYGDIQDIYTENNTISFMNGDKFSFYVNSVLADGSIKIESVRNLKTITVYDTSGNIIAAEDTKTTEEDDKIFILSLIDPVSFQVDMIKSGIRTSSGSYILILNDIPASTRSSLEASGLAVRNPNATLTVIFEDGEFKGYDLEARAMLYVDGTTFIDYELESSVRYN